MVPALLENKFSNQFHKYLLNSGSVASFFLGSGDQGVKAGEGPALQEPPECRRENQETRKPSEGTLGMGIRNMGSVVPGLRTPQSELSDPVWARSWPLVLVHRTLEPKRRGSKGKCPRSGAPCQETQVVYNWGTMSREEDVLG
jgi:hypothetical protein